MEKDKATQRILILSSSPHIRDRLTVGRLMWGVIVALSPAVAASIYFFGLQAVKLIIVCSLASLAAEYSFLWLRGKSFPKEPSALLSGLLLALVLPPTLPLWSAGLGAIFAIIVGKQIFGGLGYNIFNPALIGRAFLAATFPVLMTTWVKPFSLAAITTATPLGLMKFESQSTSLIKLFYGHVGGSLGETSALALLIGGAYLLIKRYIDWRTPLSYLGIVALLSGIFYLISPYRYGAPLFSLLAGGLMLGAFFMATDPVTTPVTKLGRWIFGLGAGVVVVVIRNWGGYPEGVMFSILLMNAFTPLLDRYIKPKVFGSGTMKKSVQMVLVLSIVGVVSGGALVGIYRYAQPRIEENRKRALKAAIFEVLPGAKSYETIVKEGKTIYKGFDSSGRLIGYAFTGEGPGYQSTIEVMIGVGPELEKTKGIEILESVETPGLGAKITEKSFRDQFRDLMIWPLIELIKGRPPEKPNQVQAITGATISSRAVVDILNKTIREVREILK